MKKLTKYIIVMLLTVTLFTGITLAKDYWWNNGISVRDENEISKLDDYDPFINNAVVKSYEHDLLRSNPSKKLQYIGGTKYGSTNTNFTNYFETSVSVFNIYQDAARTKLIEGNLSADLKINIKTNYDFIKMRLLSYNYRPFKY